MTKPSRDAVPPRRLIDLTEDDLRLVVRELLEDALAERASTRSASSQPTNTNLTVRQTAAALLTSTKTVRKYIAAGRLRAAKLGTSKSARVIVRRVDLERFLAEGAE